MSLDGELNAELKKLGVRIKEIRTSRKVTPDEIAINCGITTSFLKDIEEGKTDVSYITLNRLAECLQVSLSEILNIF